MSLRGMPSATGASRNQPLTSRPSLRLRRDLRRSLRGGHPWVYREALHPPARLPTGSVVDLLDEGGQFVARGLFDAASPIAFRAYTLDEREAIDAALFFRRLQRALALRQDLFSATPQPTDAYRWCHGEGDQLPGLVIDRYGDVAVLVLDGGSDSADPQATPLVQPFVPDIVSALVELGKSFGLRAIYQRHQRRSGGSGELLWGTLPDPPQGCKPGEVIVCEHGVRFVVDLVHGQKGGLFLDQRENRLHLRRYVAGRTLWNGFSYTGGFSLHAALAGATRVISVDRASPAIVAARRNFVLNGLDPSGHGFLAADVFQELQAALQRGERFDVVLVDPPSFAPNERSVPAALSAYRELHRLALSAVAPQGFLIAASCSSHVPEATFITTLVSAAEATGRALRIVETHGQPADHPSPPAFSEGRYLKFIVMAVD